jgi:hypothetical protein
MYDKLCKFVNGKEQHTGFISKEDAEIHSLLESYGWTYDALKLAYEQAQQERINRKN